ncbi:hypothetical protein [Reyranella soli]|uniref:hypothetical protein n=1 Tax=Reyranella soli TaxID=1230389 RepID=UPI0011BDCDDF|nr:hypothetical protein [Reyranella soli]
MMHGLGEGPLLAAPQHGTLNLAVVADRALVEASRHTGVGHCPAFEHGGGELGNARDPVVDGPRRHIEEAGQLLVGGAEQTVVAGQLAEFGSIAGGTADGVHVANITWVIGAVNHFCYLSKSGVFAHRREGLIRSPAGESHNP